MKREADKEIDDQANEYTDKRQSEILMEIHVEKAKEQVARQHKDSQTDM